MLRVATGRRNKTFSVFENLKNARRQSIQKSLLQKMVKDCDRLLGAAGESISISLAAEILACYAQLESASREAFQDTLAMRYNPEVTAITTAAAQWGKSGAPQDLVQLIRAAEPPRQELLRRLNRAPGGTAAIVKMREEILARLKKSGELAAVDADFEHLLSSWFNPGFLKLQKIDWNSPAILLERIIELEAVHAIEGWSDLRRRLEQDRRLYVYFHPALPGEPLIFVEVALLPSMPAAIAPLLDPTLAPDADPAHYRTAVFYSISTCQPGLRGIHLGNFLIKRVAKQLKSEFPALKEFCTLSPVPTLEPFVQSEAPFDAAKLGERPAAALTKLREQVRASGAETKSTPDTWAKLCAGYLLQTAPDGEGLSDPVARFHLNNGARLERINLQADLSPKGQRQSRGVMVNYAYDLADIEKNHERFASGTVCASKKVKAWLA